MTVYLTPELAERMAAESTRLRGEAGVTRDVTVTINAGFAQFIGIPFADHGRAGGGLDCWGLARAALKACTGVELPDYGDGYADCADHAGVAASIRDGLAQGWERVGDPRLYDLVIFNICGQPRHVGLMVGPTKFLHMPENGTSRIERIDDRMWAKRVEGWYRYVG